MSTPLAFLPKIRSRALRQAIAGMPCALRLATFIGQPCAPQSTVVGAHLPVVGGKGMGTKVSDLEIVAACVTCHDLLDGRDHRGLAIREREPVAFHLQLIRAGAETRARLVEAGVIRVEGAE